MVALGTDSMTNRERIFAALRGEETDRLPVWLKMANSTWQAGQPEPWRSMKTGALLRAAGCDLMVPLVVRPIPETPHVTRRVEEENGTRQTIFETPDGTLTSEERFDPSTKSVHPTKYPAETPEDLGKLRWLYTDTTYRMDAAALAEAARIQEACEAEDAVTISGAPPSPLMDLVEHMCGPVATVYLMTDVPELFCEIVSLMHADRMRHLAARLAAEPADMFWLTENTSTTLISPAMFEEFCAPHLKAYGELILEHDMIPVHHMCGSLNALLEMIDVLPAMANEAYTTRPLGDVSLAEGRRRMPSKTLIGGTNATLWLEPVEGIVEAVAADLAACPDRRKIFLTSAGVLPPPVSFEKARQAVEAFKSL